MVLAMMYCFIVNPPEVIRNAITITIVICYYYYHYYHCIFVVLLIGCYF